MQKSMKRKQKEGEKLRGKDKSKNKTKFKRSIKDSMNKKIFKNRKKEKRARNKEREDNKVMEEEELSDLEFMEEKEIRSPKKLRKLEEGKTQGIISQAAIKLLTNEEGEEELDPEDIFELGSNLSDLDFDDENQFLGDLEDKGPKTTKDKKHRKKKEKKEEAETIISTNKYFIDQKRLDFLINNLKEKNNMKSMKNIMVVFRSACRYDEEVAQGKKKIEFENSLIFHKLLTFSFQNLPKILYKKCTNKSKNTSQKTKEKTGSKKSTRIINEEKVKSIQISFIIKSFMSNLIHFIQKIEENEMKEFILMNQKILGGIFTYFTPYDKKIAQILSTIWSEADSSTLQFYAFVLLREMALCAKEPLFQYIVKRAFLGYVRNSKIVSWRNYDAINFMRNCLVELLGINKMVSYQHAFLYIRQICIILRKSLKDTSKEQLRKIYNWGILNNLKLWAQSIGEFFGNSDYKFLLNPFVELCIGIMNLQSASSKYCPFHLKIINILNSLAGKTGIFVPVMGHILEFLQLQELDKKPKKTADKSYEWNLAIKVPKLQLRSLLTSNNMVKHCFNEIIIYFANQSTQIAFPELFIPFSYLLKQRQKSFFNISHKTNLISILEKLNKHKMDIVNRRKNISIAPNDISKTNEFSNSIDPQNILVKEKQKIIEETKKYVKGRISAATN